jgi:hypothetical protein
MRCVWWCDGVKMCDPPNLNKKSFPKTRLTNKAPRGTFTTTFGNDKQGKAKFNVLY